MAKKITGYVKLQIPAAEATPAPPVGPALGQQGVNIMDFCKNFNAKTASQKGLIIPVVITVYADRSYTLHHEDAAGFDPSAEGGRRSQGLGHAEQGKGRQGDQEAGRRDREDQDARPERGGPAGGDPGRRGDGAVDGNRGRLAIRVTVHTSRSTAKSRRSSHDSIVCTTKEDDAQER